ncbi:unnamed protein product, partial [Phytomonas sp. EM1]
MLNEASLREFYEHVFPVELLVRWLSYDLGGDSFEEANGLPRESRLRPAAEAYLARREFCFTLRGDIFTRFRSFTGSSELRAELRRVAPEKIDVGAVYNTRPHLKQGLAALTPHERELVFDIDMSDYDAVRLCCSGKEVCKRCWGWLACAMGVLRRVLVEDFGFRFLLPVFSGRRGVHLWVCDRRARRMRDDERAAIVGYLAALTPRSSRGGVVEDLAQHRAIHPTIAGALAACVEPAFYAIFVDSEAENPNNMQHHPAAAKVVLEAVRNALRRGRGDALARFERRIATEAVAETGIAWGTLCRALGNEVEARDVLRAAQVLLLYPRLDEHVTTRRDHLLKLPFCVHAGTGLLCCPLRWETLGAFDPQKDAPGLEEIVMNRRYDPAWEGPLREMLQAMQEDPNER